jgi:hypothetical protein
MRTQILFASALLIFMMCEPSNVQAREPGGRTGKGSYPCISPPLQRLKKERGLIRLSGSCDSIHKPNYSASLEDVRPAINYKPSNKKVVRWI